MRACLDYPDCIIYNLTHDENIATQAVEVFGEKHVTSGPKAKLFWQIVTNLKQVKGELEKSQNQLQAIIQNVMDGIVTIDESGQIQGFNPAAEKIFGYSQQEALGENIKMFMPLANQTEYSAYLDHFLQGDTPGMADVRGREIIALRKNGELFPMELSASEMVLGGQRYFVGIVRDITERKQAEQKITHLAHYDSYHCTVSALCFKYRLSSSIAMAQRRHYKVATLFLDLDGFKKINDTLGHDVGDLLLQSVAHRLTGVVRSSDTVARMGRKMSSLSS